MADAVERALRKALKGGEKDPEKLNQVTRRARRSDGQRSHPAPPHDRAHGSRGLSGTSPRRRPVGNGDCHTPLGSFRWNDNEKRGSDDRDRHDGESRRPTCRSSALTGCRGSAATGCMRRGRRCTARALESLPGLTASFAAGELSFTKVRRSPGSRCPADEDEWIEMAQHSTGAQIERSVSAARSAVARGENADARTAFERRSITRGRRSMVWTR